MNNKIQLIAQALSAAESSIKLARQLLTELDPSSNTGNGGQRQHQKSHQPSIHEHPPIGVSNPVKEKPGIIGIFDGENMVTESGEKHPVPANYASKCMLVVGDTLKMVEDGGEKKFKQIEHIKRYRTTGMITKKEGKFRIVTPEGSYKVLPVSIEHFKGEVGDEVVAFLPAGNLTASYIAIESVNKKSTPSAEASQELKVEQKKTEAPTSPKKSEPTKPKSANGGAKSSTKDAKPQKAIEPKVETKAEPKGEELTPGEKPVEIKMPEVVGEDELR